MLLALVAMVLFPTIAWAQQSALTSKHIEKIRQNCLSAQVTLQRIQYSDIAVRINRGQAYDVMMTKFITPFNSRAALNHVSETSTLTAKTEAFEAALSQFRKHYVAYEETLSSTLQIRCQDRPVAFYDSLETTRTLRAQLSEDVDRIQSAVTDYTKVVTSIEERLAGAVQ
jgi:hypothetical protein